MARPRNACRHTQRHVGSCPTVPTPTGPNVHHYLHLWNTGVEGSLEAALKDVFALMPGNTDYGQVAVKVAALNDIYKTGILDTLGVARHIVALRIDGRLAAEAADHALVHDIARFTTSTGDVRNNYSFATKYCAFHQPDLYPIYDSYVHGVLLNLWNRDPGFQALAGAGSWRGSYAAWCRAVLAFRAHFNGLNVYSLRELDHYMWLLSKQLGLQVAF